MKLNIECIKEILFFLENNLTLNGGISTKDLCEKLNKYSEDEIKYCVKLLEEEGYINATFCLDLSATISSITLRGHMFIEKLRG